MNNQVIRDIRHYEQKTADYVGNFDGMLGNVYKSSFEIKCIAQRIARKLNELKFNTGSFHHLYINLTTQLNNGIIIDYDYVYDKRIRCFDFAQNRDEFNSMTDWERERKISTITFEVLKWKFGQNDNSNACINAVENLIESEGKKVVINYKTKETSIYNLNIGFQIAPTDNNSTIIIDYLLKKSNVLARATLNINHYEDIYYLIDKISVDGQQIIFYPKKSVEAGFVVKQYPTPLTTNISELTTIE